MGHRYQNKLDEENERRYLASLSPLKRRLYKLGYWLCMLAGGFFAFYGMIGWWLLKLLGF